MDQMRTMADLSKSEKALVDCHESLTAVLATARDELHPYQERNAIKALVALRQVLSGLGIDAPYPYEYETPIT